MARLQKHPDDEADEEDEDDDDDDEADDDDDDEADGDKEDKDDDGADLPWPEVVLPPPLRHLHQGEKKADKAPANKKESNFVHFSSALLSAKNL